MTVQLSRQAFCPSAQAIQVFPTPQGPVIIRLRASLIQRPVASCWNRARSSLRGVRKSTSSIAAPMWRSFAARMRVWNRRVSRLATSRSTRRPSHSAWLSSTVASCACKSMNASAMPSSFIWRSRSRVGWVNIVCPFNGSNRGRGYCQCWDRGPVRGRFGPFAMEVVLQDRIDRGVGPRTDHRAPARRLLSSALGAVRFGQADMMPRQERNPCSGWLRSRRITSTSVAVLGPIFAAQFFSRSGDHSEWRRWLAGM